MTETKMKTLTACLLLASISVFISCKKEAQNANENISLPKIEGFYFFKQNMSFKEVTNVLIKNKIKYRIINKDSLEEINSPIDFYHHLIFKDDFKDLKNIKFIEGYNLSILDKNLERFQICFFNDTIFYFIYKNNFEEKFAQNTVNNENVTLRSKLKSNLNLLLTLSEGLNYKYGFPHFKIGDFNSPTSSVQQSDKWDDYNHKGIQHFQKEVWFSKDSIMHIELENFLKIDTIKINPPLINNQLNSEIKVLFNSKYSKIIEDSSRKKDSIKDVKKRATEKREFDSIHKEKTKQFKKL